MKASIDIVIQSKYDGKWEDLSIADDMSQAKLLLKNYQHHNPKEQYRIVKRFVPREGSKVIATPYQQNPISVKNYACKECGYQTKQSTNHYGETYSYGNYSVCPKCPPYKRPNTWVCLDTPPAGEKIPTPWKTTTLGNLIKKNNYRNNPYREMPIKSIEVKLPKRKSSTNEWVVRVFVNGRNDDDKAYYTDDKQDALDTYKYMLEQYRVHELRDTVGGERYFSNPGKHDPTNMSGKRFFVIAKLYHVTGNVRIVDYSSNREWLLEKFNNQYKHSSSITPFVFGKALCNITRYGNMSWGLFEEENV